MSATHTTTAPAPPPRGPLERFLRVFTDVRQGEGVQLLLLTLNVFLILTAYYVMKPVREALILDQPGGAELKSYAYAAQALLLVVLVPIYGSLATRLPRRRLINCGHRLLHRLLAPVLSGRRGEAAGRPGRSSSGSACSVSW